MNILYIIGNGFDIAQGMKTSYPDFYEYLEKVKVDNKSDLLKQMLKEIDENKERWADMEREFGKFTSTIQTSKKFIALYKELSHNLLLYLNEEDEKMRKYTGAHRDMEKSFRDSFFNPFSYLAYPDGTRFDKFRKSIVGKFNFYVMSFNYTLTLERKLGFTKIPYTDGDCSLRENIIHVHGRLDEAPIIIGVDNKMQIANEEFRENDDIKDYIVKSQSITVAGKDWEDRCLRHISHAHVIFLYGVSLGETDNKWWKMIKEQMVARRDIVIIYHVYEPEIENEKEFPQGVGQYKREYMQNLLEKLGLTNDGNITSRLYLIINSNIFKEKPLFQI
ncbi:MAG: bacteriophage abortive infection AbiH family protein [Prevotella sp.]|nr:bacteriophage abortive infection AbiH family protein [Prevotella sp.]